MSGDGPVIAKTDGAVVEIGLNNGPLNLVTRDLLRALNGTLREISSRNEVRCVIIHGGRARAFCAGSDMKEFAEIKDNASERKILFEDMVLRQLASMPMPTVAAIDGPALGGGLEIALACDLRVCKAGVTLGLTESGIGGLAGNGSVRLARLIGPGRAKELLFTAETISSEQALAWGMVNRLATETSALDAARELARTIVSRGPLSNRLAKKLVDVSLDQPLDAALSVSTVAQQQIFDSQDLQEGVDAFFKKRPAKFTDG